MKKNEQFLPKIGKFSYVPVFFSILSCTGFILPLNNWGIYNSEFFFKENFPIKILMKFDTEYPSLVAKLSPTQANPSWAEVTINPQLWPAWKVLLSYFLTWNFACKLNSTQLAQNWRKKRIRIAMASYFDTFCYISAISSQIWME